ncbi:hypothetical protein F4778DRAFT_748349 [Xylariomycetidae sp. FL2044]|nr:hypothetical protein F4778DRAFT_748349 [Xylariomycetidae sp. FL2044]
MPPIERDAPVDRPMRHQHSNSISAIVPMWDSSDPERAPPPLPLNPQSPGVGTSRSGTSLAIQSAHAALTEKARETALIPHITKRMSETSPERALVQRPSPHKRMQSLQPGSVRDLSLMIEGARDSANSTPRGSPEKERYPRPSTPNRKEQDRDVKPAEKENTAPGTPTPLPSSLSTTMRPSMRRPPQSILGENTPPQSATMLALHNMSSSTSREAESPLATVTNNSNALVKSSASTEHLSTQLLTLTNIATALQKEMSQLSRRSRDNATDLMSLKEATHARDEDIRKSLRELAMGQDHPRYGHRDTYTGGLYLDNKPHNTSPTTLKTRPFSLPRIPSPNSFAASIDRESSLSTPSLVGGDSPATLALLEKIIRDMGTKDGQDTVISRLSELAEKLSGMASSVKVEELIQHLKTASQDQAVIPAAGSGRSRNFSFETDDENQLRELDWSHRNGPMTQRVERILNEKEGSRRSSAPPSRANELLNDDVLKIIKSVKDSVAQGGGLTAEVKALVRELRGEVLGMGREIARKLEESHHRAPSKSETASRAELARIVEEGLEQMKVYMQQRLRDHRRESTESTKSGVDYQEIYNAMKSALLDVQATKDQEPHLVREDVMDAVKDAWENYKPEIQIEQIGLERDEVLACLQEGLQAYAPQHDLPQGASKEEVFKAVVEGLKHFSPPQVDTPASLSRDEILEAVRECLEEFEFPVAPSAMNNDLTRDDMVDAVKQGLEGFDFPTNEAALVPHGGDNGEVMERLHDIMRYLQDEFKAVSEEAKQNVAANGRDTEQVLDATKDGFEQLRTHMEDYVDRASGAAGQEELITSVLSSLDHFRDELSELVEKASDGPKEMLRQEIESLRDTMNSSLVPHVPPPSDNKEILEAIREGIERVRGELLRPHAGTTDILDALHEGFGDLHSSIERMNNKPVDLTANDEILDALKAGLEGVRGDIGSLKESHDNDKAVAPVGAVPSDAIIPADLVRHDDIKNLEVMMTQLRIKMEAMETAQPGPAPEGISRDDLAEMEELLRKGVSKEDLNEMEEMLRNMQESMAEMSSKDKDKEKDKEDGESEDAPPANLEDAATKEDALAIETILRNTKSRLDDLIDGEQAVRKDHVDAIEALVLEAKDNLGTFAVQLDGVTKKEDLVGIESLVTQVTASLDEMKERAEKSLEDPEKVTKTDVDAIEAAVHDVKSTIEQIIKSDIATLPSKDDLKTIEDTVKELKETIAAKAEADSRAIEDRQTSTAEVNERVTEVKAFLEEFQGMVKEKLESGGTGIDGLVKLLESLSEAMGQNATVGADLKEMFETMKFEFEESKAGVVGAKLDTDEKLKETTDALSTKVDEKIDELMNKYDEFQLVMEDRTKAGEARDVGLEEAVVGSKAVSEELKVLVDTLGSTVTDSLDKMEEASKTVFEKVEMLYAKAEDNHSDGKNDHQMTRDQVKQAVTAVEGLQGHVCEYQPKILESIKDVLLIVGEHYEHSKSSSTDIQKQIEDAKPPVKEEPPLLPPVEKYDDTEVQSKLDKMDSEVHSKLDQLIEKSEDTEVQSKLDKMDGEVQSKLDQLVDHTHEAGKAYAQLDTLDKVHQQVVQTAAEISEFLSSQKQRIADDHEDYEKTLQETKLALERQRAEQEHVEVNLTYLRDEEAQLRESILALRTEQELLARQKTRLTADVSSLETALHLRREELHAMDARAEGLERRILEGVLDHSRALLLTKSSSSSAKGRDAMSRKRVPAAARSSLGAADINGSRPPPSSSSSKPAPRPKASAMNVVTGHHRASLVPPNPGRRILSLSQITNNVPTGGLKRSQSVRTAAAAGGGAALRKSSWAPGRFGAVAGEGGGKGYGELNKENVDLVRESDEEKENENGEGDDVRELTPTPTPEPCPVEDPLESSAVVEMCHAATPTSPTPADEGEGEGEAGVDDDGDDDDNVTETDAHDDVTDIGPDDDNEATSEVGTLRRSSLGTTVLTTTETEMGTDGGSSVYTYDDESAVDGGSSISGSGSGVTMDDDSIVSESIADTDSIAGEGEVVVYAA